MITALLMLTGCSMGSGNSGSSDTSTAAAAVSVTVPTDGTTAAVSAEEQTQETEKADVTETVETTDAPFEDTPERAYDTLSAFLDSLDVKYPPDYAGAYGYFGKLYVCTTAAEPPSYYKDILGDYTCVSYRTVSHSLEYLENAAETAAKILSEKYIVTDYYADVPSNKAAVCLAGCDLTEARRYVMSQPDLPFSKNEMTFILDESYVIPETVTEAVSETVSETGTAAEPTAEISEGTAAGSGTDASGTAAVSAAQ